jgi:predicted transglutaminase-like cysteine proteinase
LRQGQRFHRPAAVSKAGSAALTVKKRDLQQIQDYVQWRFDYTSDIEQRGVPEHWVDASELESLDSAGRGTFKDDCDGHALACRYQCRKLQIPNRLVFCQTETGEYHLVLEVEGWILDNRRRWVIDRGHCEYKWISISGYEKGDPWHEVYTD